MKTIFNTFARKLFGAGPRQPARSLFVCAVLFLGLRAAGLRLPASPAVLCLTVSAFTAGVMHQALCARDNADALQNLLMLPFENRAFVFGYTAALGAYTLLTKTAPLLAVLYAVTDWQPAALALGLLCALHAALLAAALFPLRQGPLPLLWAAAVAAALVLSAGGPPAFLLLGADSLLAMLLLGRADGYAFYLPEKQRRRRVTGHRRHSVALYFGRYLADHKNYLVNTAALWGVACLLPLLLRPIQGLFTAPMGFAILCLNTPLGILLSCDPPLEQAVRTLPGQGRAFCIPYALFLAAFNLAADGIFLLSWQVQFGGVTARMLLAAPLFALQGAVLSVLLEWFFPLRGWKIESDLWHHPRKYAVPLALLLPAAVLGAQPALVPVLGLLLAAELAILLLRAGRML